MSVAELIDYLENFDQDLEVYVPGSGDYVQEAEIYAEVTSVSHSAYREDVLLLDGNFYR